MLSGFQEAAQKIQDKDEYALAPFYLFYDTVHTFLDSSIRRVIERCQKAADNGDGIEQQDVDVLKLLYLIRYVDDIPVLSGCLLLFMLYFTRLRVCKISLFDLRSASAPYQCAVAVIQSELFINRRDVIHIDDIAPVTSEKA